MKRIFAFIFLTFALACFGCATSPTLSDLKSSPEGVVHFKIERNYESAYQIAISKMREKYEVVFFGGSQMKVFGDLYHDSQTGKIIVLINNPYAKKSYLLYVEIKSLSSDTCIVNISYSLKSLKKDADELRDSIIHS